MTPSLSELGIDRLCIEDRIALAQELWESAAQEAELTSPSEAQRLELERRLAGSIARPDAVVDWEAVKARALERARR